MFLGRVDRRRRGSGLESSTFQFGSLLMLVVRNVLELLSMLGICSKDSQNLHKVLQKWQSYIFEHKKERVIKLVEFPNDFLPYKIF